MVVTCIFRVGLKLCRFSLIVIILLAKLYFRFISQEFTCIINGDLHAALVLCSYSEI